MSHTPPLPDDVKQQSEQSEQSEQPSTAAIEHPPRIFEKNEAPPASRTSFDPAEAETTYPRFAGDLRWSQRSWLYELMPFRGIYYDVKRRLPFVASDWTTAFYPRNWWTVAQYIPRMYFINLMPAISYIIDMNYRTGGAYGLNEVILASALAAIVFPVLSVQPLTFVGVTGLINLVNYTQYDLVVGYYGLDRMDYLRVQAWSLIWAAGFHFIVSVFNICDFTRFITDMTSQTFGFYVGIVYIQKGVELLILEFEPLPLDNATGWLSVTIAVLFSVSVYLVTAIGKTSFLPFKLRYFISSFAFAAGCIFWTGFSHFPDHSLRRVPIERLPITKSFFPTIDRSWFIDFWNIEARWAFVGAPLGFLIMLLFYFDHNVSSVMSQARQFPVKRPAGFHWDFFLLGITTLVSGFLGLPAPNGLVPQCPWSTESLSVYKQVEVPKGEGDEEGNPLLRRRGKQYARQHVVNTRVVENRVGHLVVGLLTLGTMTRPLLVVLGTMPRAIFAGIFLLVGWSSIEGNVITTRTLAVFKDRHLAKEDDGLLKLERSKIALFVGIQWIFFAMTIAISQTIAAVGFPVIITLLIPFRYYIVPRWFSPTELRILDAPTADADVVLASIGQETEAVTGQGQRVARDTGIAGTEWPEDSDDDDDEDGQNDSGFYEQRPTAKERGQAGDEVQGYVIGSEHDKEDEEKFVKPSDSIAHMADLGGGSDDGSKVAAGSAASAAAPGTIAAVPTTLAVPDTVDTAKSTSGHPSSPQLANKRNKSVTQSWWGLGGSKPVERAPTPKTPVTPTVVEAAEEKEAKEEGEQGEGGQTGPHGLKKWFGSKKKHSKEESEGKGVDEKKEKRQDDSPFSESPTSSAPLEVASNGTPAADRALDPTAGEQTTMTAAGGDETPKPAPDVAKSGSVLGAGAVTGAVLPAVGAAKGKGKDGEGQEETATVEDVAGKDKKEEEARLRWSQGATAAAETQQIADELKQKEEVTKKEEKEKRVEEKKKKEEEKRKAKEGKEEAKKREKEEARREKEEAKKKRDEAALLKRQERESADRKKKEEKESKQREEKEAAEKKHQEDIEAAKKRAGAGKNDKVKEEAAAAAVVGAGAGAIAAKANDDYQFDDEARAEEEEYAGKKKAGEGALAPVPNNEAAVEKEVALPSKGREEGLAESVEKEKALEEGKSTETKSKKEASVVGEEPAEKENAKRGEAEGEAAAAERKKRETEEPAMSKKKSLKKELTEKEEKKLALEREIAELEAKAQAARLFFAPAKVAMSSLHALSGQVAGHEAGVYTIADEALVVKSTSTAESSFYQNVLIHHTADTRKNQTALLARLQKYLPTYHGTIDITSEEPGSGGLAVILENLTRGYKHANVLDIKLGRQLWDEGATEEKKKRMDEAAKSTTSAGSGLRLTGWQLWDKERSEFVKVGKRFGKSIKADHLSLGLRSFFGLASTADAERVSEFAGEQIPATSLPEKAVEVILRDGVLPAVKEIADIVRKLEWRVRGGSLLVVFEGDEEVLRGVNAKSDLTTGRRLTDADQLVDAQHLDSVKVSQAGQRLVDVRLIDFAHASFGKEKGADEGYLAGLECTKGLLEDLTKALHKGALKKRASVHEDGGLKTAGGGVLIGSLTKGLFSRDKGEAEKKDGAQGEGSGKTGDKAVVTPIKEEEGDKAPAVEGRKSAGDKAVERAEGGGGGAAVKSKFKEEEPKGEAKTKSHRFSLFGSPKKQQQQQGEEPKTDGKKDAKDSPAGPGLIGLFHTKLTDGDKESKEKQPHASAEPLAATKAPKKGDADGSALDSKVPDYIVKANANAGGKGKAKETNEQPEVAPASGKIDSFWKVKEPETKPEEVASSLPRSTGPRKLVRHTNPSRGAGKAPPAVQFR